MTQNPGKPLIDFTSYNKERTLDFTGREWVFQAINDWLANPDGSRYFLLTGEPGSGKTAVAARLAQCSVPSKFSLPDALTALRPGFLNAVHFCSARDHHWINPHVFTASLALQLSAHYPAFAKALAERSGDRQIVIQVNQLIKNVENGQVTGVIIENLDVRGISPEDAFIQVVREPLEALLREEPNEQVVILVDGLDEALLYSGKVGIVSLLAQTDELPTGVRFILTSRKDERVENEFLDADGISLSAGEYEERNQEDLSRYLELRLKHDKELAVKVTELSREQVQKMVTEISKKAAGNFLYVRFLLDAMARGQRSLTELEGLPEGLDGLYFESLKRVVKLGRHDWRQAYAPLMGILSVAQTELTQTQLEAFTQQSESDIWEYLGALQQFIKVVEPQDSAEEKRYRLYHQSIIDFLHRQWLVLKKKQSRNTFYLSAKESHHRIVTYYSSKAPTLQHIDWRQECDLYGLRQLVGHMQARLRLEQNQRERIKQAEELYAVVLDPAFLQAQSEKLGGIHSTLNDLLTTLEIALTRNDLVKALACIAIYRDTIRGQSICQAIFEAAEMGNLELAMQQAAWYDIAPDPRRRWVEVLYLYLAWEAAEQGNVEATRKLYSLVERLPRTWFKKLSNALLMRIGRSLARTGDGSCDAETWLAELGLTRNLNKLLKSYDSAHPLDASELQTCKEELEHWLDDFTRQVAQGDHVPISKIPLPGKKSIRGLLVKLAAVKAGQNGIDQALKLVLSNPSLRYRNFGLVVLAAACLSVPESSWVRQRLQSILRTALDHEGVAFTFDLPAILLAEAQKRKLPAQELADYFGQALSSNDRWGTVIRARSAHAAALFRQDRKSDAIRELEEAATLPSGYASYATVTLLSLVNRWWEFGLSDSSSVANLINDSAWQAEQVRDPQFRKERMELVKTYRDWSREDAPDTETVRTTLSATPDPDTRRVYKDFISARWAGPIDRPNLEGLKILVPTALADSTTLDIILGRLFGLNASQLCNHELVEAIRLCTTHFINNRPWELGQWR